jgi:hypothetical protein
MSDYYYNDPKREAARFLHFEYENPPVPDVLFRSEKDACAWIEEGEWKLANIFFTPTGFHRRADPLVLPDGGACFGASSDRI